MDPRSPVGSRSGATTTQARVVRTPSWSSLVLFAFLVPVAGFLTFDEPALAKERRVPASLLNLEERGMRVGALFTLEGMTVASHRADQPMNPASVTKLFTAAAAVAILGADATLETRVLATTKPSDHPGQGRSATLAIVGAGDPLLTQGHLREMARCVRQAGIEEVSSLVVDTGPFNHDALPPAYDRKDTDAPYRAGIGGLQVDLNRILVTIRPGKPGSAPAVRVEPESAYVRVVNDAITEQREGTAKRRREPLRVLTLPDPSGGLIVRVQGRLRGSRPVVVAKRVPNPATHAGYVFRASLEREGVRVGGGPVIGRAPDGAEVVCRHRSPPVREMLVPVLKDSQNQVAESLLRLCGAARSQGPVGFREGARVLHDFLTREVHLDSEHFRFWNGSGLYDANLVTARAVVRLLQYLRTNDSMRPVIEALPVAGEDGTLKNRFKNTALQGRVRAKTGTLDGVVTLAGYVDLAGGRTLTFAVLIAGEGKIPAGTVRKAMDDALIEIAQAFEKTSPRGGKRPPSRTIR